MDAIAIDPRNPLRPPAWRWFRAQNLTSSLRRFGRWDDPDVRRAVRFFRAVQRSGGDPDHPRVRRTDPVLQDAFSMYQGGGERRWEVEARLLARQDDAAIATLLGGTKGVIAAYETLWFDVRSRLAAADWIVAIVAGNRRNEPATPNLEMVWKLCGYHLGPFVLDRLVALQRRERTTGIAAHDHGGIVDPTALLVRIMMPPADERSGPQCVQLAVESDRLDRRSDACAAAPTFAPLVGRRLNQDVLGGRLDGTPRRGPNVKAGGGTAIPEDQDDDREPLGPLEPLRWPAGSVAGFTGRREVG